jgi:hypothetical protein
MLSAFLDAFSTENVNVRASIQDALIQMLPSFRHSLPQIGFHIFPVLFQNCQKAHHQNRYVSTRYAVDLFSFSSIQSRFLCILAAADEKIEVQEEGFRGLSFQNVDPNEYPEIPKLLEFIFDQVAIIDANLHKSASANIRNIPSDVFLILLRFLRQLLIKSLIPTAEITLLSTDWDPLEEKLSISNRKLFKEGLSARWSTVGALEIVDVCEAVLKTEKAGLYFFEIRSVPEVHRFIYFTGINYLSAFGVCQEYGP